MTDEHTNAAPWSVSELAVSLKRTLETQYDHVRLRGEVSKVTRHSSGHVYLTLKDDKAAIDGVIWKGQVSRLKTQPESGLEVIATGKITTFPASSKYQIVIEQMEVAGVGALLAQLERIKARLHSEGLFDPARKKPLPFAPATIGVITSPTGAVVRDILHRIRDRWPCRVIVWPVLVQGDQAAPQVIRALEGFQNGEVDMPDVIIVARGGGSVEDLWPFNDEALARAVAACGLPVISAVGHETDTTLIDYVSDRRAPTPTGAAEMATPVLGELKAFVADLERRREATFTRQMDMRRERVALLSRALPRPQDLIDHAQQRLDYAAHRLDGALLKNLSVQQTRFAQVSGRLSPSQLNRTVEQSAQSLEHAGSRLSGALRVNYERHKVRFAPLGARLAGALTRRVEVAKAHARLPQLEARLEDAMQRGLRLRADHLRRLEQLRLSLNPDRPLDLGFARVNRKDGALVTSPEGVAAGEALTLTFKGDQRLDVTAGHSVNTPGAQSASVRRKAVPPSTQQGDLF